MHMHLLIAFSCLFNGIKTLSTFVCVEHSGTRHFVCVYFIHEISILFTKFSLFNVDFIQEISTLLFTKF